jgi:hypothetical protein
MEARHEFRVARRNGVCLVLVPRTDAGLEGTSVAQGQRASEDGRDVRGTTRPAGRGDEKECVVTLRIRYRGELPDQLDNVIENRIHDFIVARGKNVFARVKATVAEEA